MAEIENAEEKDVGGRPLIVMDDDQVAQVEALAAVINQEQIADYFGFSERTFRNIQERQPEVFAAYRRGRAKAVVSVGGKLLQRARQGCFRSMKLYLNTQGGWRENVDVTSAGRQLPTSITVTPPPQADTQPEGE